MLRYTEMNKQTDILKNKQIEPVKIHSLIPNVRGTQTGNGAHQNRVPLQEK